MSTSKCEPRYGSTNPTPAKQADMPVKRFASVIGLNPEKEEYYRKLHADVWPTVIDRLRKSNIRNYSIHVSEIAGKRYLFSYFEYTGQNLESDMRAIAEDAATTSWWKETDPCQLPLPTRKPGANWSDMDLVFLME